MTQFTLRKGEKLQIGPDITVEVTSIIGHAVKLGFVAPRDVIIHREEVRAKILARYSEGGGN